MNLKIKFRESFRPFARSVLRECVHEWFDMHDESPYMLLVAPVAKRHTRELTAEELWWSWFIAPGVPLVVLGAILPRSLKWIYVGWSNSSETTPRASRWKNALKNLTLFAAVFFLCGVLAEVTLRLMGYGNVEIYEPNPKVIWRLRLDQNCYTKIDHKPVHASTRTAPAVRSSPTPSRPTPSALSRSATRARSDGV